jgi:uncharacterized OsmC-like protein
MFLTWVVMEAFGTPPTNGREFCAISPNRLRGIAHLSLRRKNCISPDMALETKITYLDGVRFQIEARGHEIVSDQPPENGGTDRGMTPPELLLASLGSCAAYYAAEYLRARNLPSAGLTASVTAEKGQKPARIANLRINLSIRELNDQRHRDGILRAVKNCLVHNTLLHAPAIEIALESAGADVDQHLSETAVKI